MKTAIDISNYTGNLTQNQALWLKRNTDLVIVRLSTEDGGGQREIAAQQVSVLASYRIPWQGYLWCYWQDNPVDHWARATEKLPKDWPGYHSLGIWLDMEDKCDPPLLALSWVYRYKLLLKPEGFEVGVYTGEWWLDAHRSAFTTHLAPIWRTFPLWFANYSVPPGGALPGAAPWEKVAMHQYRVVEDNPVLPNYDVSDILAEV